MVSLETPVCDFGWKAVDFDLLGVDGKRHNLSTACGENGLLVMFICNHCPYVKHIQEMLLALARDYIPKGISFAAINSNDPITYPEDGPEEMKKLAKELDFPFPYLFDASQATAKAYDAACTPDCYVFDSKLALAYRGQFDGARPGNDAPVDGHSIRHALDALLAGNPLDEADQKPSMGCNIKWQAP
mgnify:CR=1 FL=1